jgi:hypothetical protein
MWRAYSWSRWNKIRSSVAGSAPSHRSPGRPISARSWDSTTALVRAAWACSAVTRSSGVSSGATYQRPSRLSPQGSPTSRPSNPHSSQRSQAPDGRRHRPARHRPALPGLARPRPDAGGPGRLVRLAQLPRGLGTPLGAHVVRQLRPAADLGTTAPRIDPALGVAEPSLSRFDPVQGGLIPPGGRYASAGHAQAAVSSVTMTIRVEFATLSGFTLRPPAPPIVVGRLRPGGK